MGWKAVQAWVLARRMEGHTSPRPRGRVGGNTGSYSFPGLSGAERSRPLTEAQGTETGREGRDPGELSEGPRREGASRGSGAAGGSLWP